MPECAFTSPVIIVLGMLVMYCMQFVMSVSVVSMVSWCGVSWCYVYVGYGDVLEVFCVYFDIRGPDCIQIFSSWML